MEDLLTHEPAIRLGAFAGVLGAMVLWEMAAPRRVPSFRRWLRWPGNLGIAALNTGLIRLLSPITAIGMAALAAERGWGLLNLTGTPAWLAIPLAVLLLDLALYLQHRLFHAVPLLWRLHRMHHADLDFDVTTGVRFHTVEIVLSLLIKLAVVGLVGAPAVAVVIFEVALNATSMFNHANVRVPAWVEPWLRRLVVTPDMHRVHHSILPKETDSNFGFNLPWWDRLLGTYRPQPQAGHEGMTIGIADFRTPRDLRLDRMLVQPLRATVERHGRKDGAKAA
jgi:sterol desaturase/sphingolipid hydroxylase (fatty acid hydroxylase superfamily)